MNEFDRLSTIRNGVKNWEISLTTKKFSVQFCENCANNFVSAAGKIYNLLVQSINNNMLFL